MRRTARILDAFESKSDAERLAEDEERALGVYRKPAAIAVYREAALEPEPELKRGPTRHCPACGNSNNYSQFIDTIPAAKRCTPNHRVRVGWFRRCARPGHHLHQRCRSCGARWVRAVLEEGEVFE